MGRGGAATRREVGEGRGEQVPSAAQVAGIQIGDGLLLPPWSPACLQPLKAPELRHSTDGFAPHSASSGSRFKPRAAGERVLYRLPTWPGEERGSPCPRGSPKVHLASRLSPSSALLPSAPAFRHQVAESSSSAPGRRVRRAARFEIAGEKVTLLTVFPQPVALAHPGELWAVPGGPQRVGPRGFRALRGP